MHRWKAEIMRTGYHDDFRLSVILNYLFMVMIPFLILMAVFLIYFTWSATNSYGESTGKLIESEQKRLNALSQSYVNSSMFLYYGDQLESMGRSSSIDGKLESALKETMERQLSGQIDVDEMIIRDGKTVIAAGQKYEISEEEIAQYDEVLERAGGKPVWITAIRTRPKNGSGYRMVLGRSLNSSEHRNIGKLYLLVDINAMANIIGNLTEKDGVTYLLNAQNVILNSSDSSLIGGSADLKQWGIQEDRGYQICTVDGVKSMAVYEKSYRTGWTLVHIVPVKDITSGLHLVFAVAFLVAALYMASLWIMLRRLNRNILIPIAKLAGNMDDFAAGKRNVRADPQEKGEFGRLNRHFNDMTDRIVSLLEQNTREEREKNDFKMKALTSQLSPHFLYNALNTIKWMAVINRQNNIQDLTDALIRILMATAQSGKDYYRVSDEIGLIRSYSVIQKARFMNFSIEYDISEEASNCMIRRFLIQPVVENAIVHGFSRGGMRNGKVEIRIWTDDALHILITDNGCGFDTSQLIRRETEPVEGSVPISHSSLALDNIMQIIAIDYGAPYHLTITSQIGKGTTAEYFLPVIRGKIDSDD